MFPPDYESLIDAPTWEFIRRTEAAYPPDTASLSVQEQRAIYDAMARRFHRGHPPGVVARDETVAGVPCRRYPGAGPTVLYLHGGGFVVGGLDSHDDVCAEIRAHTGLTVISADYRLAPEHRHPAAFDDALAVAEAIEGPLVLAGDSAGGNLAAAVAHRLRGAPRVRGQVLVYPGLGGAPGRGSYVTHARAPMLTAEDVAYYSAIRHAGPEPMDDPTSAPLRDRDFSGLPPTVAFAAECDPLADDARDYVERIQAAGGRAVAVTEAGLIHGYLRARTTVPRAATSFDRIVSAIAALARGDWPIGDLS